VHATSQVPRITDHIQHCRTHATRDIHRLQDTITFAGNSAKVRGQNRNQVDHRVRQSDHSELTGYENITLVEL
jgi:hypothetical protein